MVANKRKYYSLQVKTLAVLICPKIKVATWN